MLRSMFSGVSGLRAHQTRMDTIGNNIANVNTFGYKSQRTTFRDIYYQNISSASTPTAALGGQNSSQVGYGSQVGSVDVMMNRSTFTMTDQAMDLAIDGDGFIQVMDGDGNTFYTRAGMLNFDAAGNLVDMQGNYVLGVNGDPTGRGPGSERIQVNLPYVQPGSSFVDQVINNKKFNISTSNATAEGNVNMTFSTDSSLGDDEVVAQISASGINIKMNPNNNYKNLDELNSAINKAIVKANGGKAHPAGNFTISYNGADDIFGDKGLTAEEITSTNFGINLGTAAFDKNKSFFGGLSTTGTVGTEFSASGTMEKMESTYDAGPPAKWNISITMSDGSKYTGVLDDSRTSEGIFSLQKEGGSENDTIEMKRPSFENMTKAWEKEYAELNPGDPIPDPPTSFKQVEGKDMGDGTNAPKVKPSEQSRALGFSGTSFVLRKGTEGGEQTLSDMTGIAIAPNGVILGLDSQGTQVMIGRIDLATFANQSGLDSAGSSNFIESANSGRPVLTMPGTNGAGKLVSGSLELSNVDLSKELSELITTQRGYQASSRMITVSDTMLEELVSLKR